MKKFLFVLLICITPDIFSQQSINSDLVVHYRFDNNFEDSSGNSFHATNQGSILSEDRHGNSNSAVYFNGIDSYIDLPNEDDLKPNMPFTISFWIKYASDDYQNQEVFELSYEENRNSGVYFNSEIGTNNLAINIANGAYNYVSFARKSFVSSNSIELNTWKNISVVVNNPSDMKIYSDCNETGGNYSGTANNLVYSNTIGVLGKRQRDLNSNPNFFNGYIDDFKIWDRALNPEEISSLCKNLSNNQFDNFGEKLTIYPNPSDGKLFLKTKIDFTKIIIFNQIGSKILTLNYQNEVNLNSLDNGIYFLNFIGNHNSITRKIIISK
ncbi:LamG-like jellyroll fold domain-containing protein [Psychroflexus salis]|nr:LamG-like jellyroll fold domain-containing protein [Psychroflexus salis]